MSRSFEITYAQLAAMRLLTSNDESRICLCGVHVEIRNDEVTLIATCGRRIGLLSVGVSYGGDCEFTIPNHLLAAMAETRDFFRGQLMVHYDAPQITISNGRLDLSAADATTATGAAPFPGWRKVFSEEAPPAVETPQVVFNSEYLVGFWQAAQLLDSNIRMVPHGELEPVEVYITTEPRFYGLFMPMRDVTSDVPRTLHRRPDWVQKLLAPAQAQPSNGSL